MVLGDATGISFNQGRGLPWKLRTVLKARSSESMFDKELVFWQVKT